MRRIFLLWVASVASALVAFSGVWLRGTVLDPSGRPINAANVDVTDARGRKIFSGNTNTAGEFVVASLPPGRYLAHAHGDHFEDSILPVIIGQRGQSIVISLALRREKYSVTVSEQAKSLDTSTDAHQDALTLGPEELDRLPVRDGDVLSALSFFTNPAGGQSPTIVVDGMERTDSVTLTPSMIQQVRINTNEYSVVFPKPGKDRIEIDTKGGGDAFHGDFSFRARNSLFDARNPFASDKPPFSRYGYEAALSGALWPKKLYFFVSADREQQQQVAPLLAYLPTGLLSENVLTPLTQNSATARIDWMTSEANKVSGKYELHQDVASDMGVGGLILPDAGVNRFHHDYRLEFGDQYVISTHTLNTFRLALGTNYEKFTSESNMPSIVVAGAFQEGGAQRNDWRKEPRTELVDSLSSTSGSLTIKAGIEARFHPFRNFSADDFGGAYQFASLNAYLQKETLLYTVNAGNPFVVSEQDDYDWYLQCEKQYRQVTLFAGVRHEFQTHFDRYGNVAPRLALAWSPGQDKRTVVRLGGGIFYDRRPPAILQQAASFNGVSTLSYLIENPSFPVANSMLSAGVQASTVFQLDPSMTFPRIYQTSATIERQLPSGFLATAEYTYQRGEHLFRTRNINAPLPLTAMRPDQEEGNVNQIESSASSRGNVLNVTLKSPAKQRYQFMAQYALSYLRDDTSNVFGPPPPGGMGPPPGAGLSNRFALPADNYNLRPEWGPANNDIRHRFGLSGTVQLPRHFTLGTLTSLHSGLPYDITTGEDNNRDTDPNDRPSGVTRNTARGAGFVSVDVHLARLFRFDFEGIKLDCELAADSFDVTNHRNPSTYVGVVTSPLFGEPDAGYNGREMQFSVRLHF